MTSSTDFYVAGNAARDAAHNVTGPRPNRDGEDTRSPGNERITARISGKNHRGGRPGQCTVSKNREVSP